MQLSIELLPAPFGPMIARISCSLTSNVMSVSAFTPPKWRLMFLTSRMTSPMGRVAMSDHAARPNAGNVGTSIILSVAATFPVRPSSNLTSVSTYCSVLPS